MIIIAVILEKKLRQKSDAYSVTPTKTFFKLFYLKLEKIYVYVSLELINKALPYDRLMF